MPIDIQYWISNDRNVLLYSYDILSTKPDLVKTDDFFYCKSETLDFKRVNTIQNEVFNYGAIYANKIEFHKCQKFIGLYNDDSPLLFCRVPNSIHRGVVCTCQKINGNFLITSGALSGCTACSVYIPDLNKIAFFHVGRNKLYEKREGIKTEYTQETKNADLYRSIKLLLNPRAKHYGETQLRDDELIIKLKELLANFSYAYIHIYIQGNSQNVAERHTYSIDEVKKCIILRYYKAGDMHVSKFDNLFSVHFMEKTNLNTYNTIDRYNLII